MIVTLKSTTKEVLYKGASARVWEGITANGIEVQAFVLAVNTTEEDRLEDFIQQLQQHSTPSALVEAIPTIAHP